MNNIPIVVLWIAVLGSWAFGTYTAFTSHHNYDKSYLFFPPYAWYVVLDHYWFSAPSSTEIAQNTRRYSRYAVSMIGTAWKVPPQEINKFYEAKRELNLRIFIMPSENIEKIKITCWRFIKFHDALMNGMIMQLENLITHRDMSIFYLRMSPHTQELMNDLAAIPGMNEVISDFHKVFELWRDRISTAKRRGKIQLMLRSYIL